MEMSFLIAKQIFTQKFESPGFQIEHQINKALMINVKAQLMERDAIFVQLLANYLKCNAIELLR